MLVCLSGHGSLNVLVLLSLCIFPSFYLFFYSTTLPDWDADFCALHTSGMRNSFNALGSFHFHYPHVRIYQQHEGLEQLCPYPIPSDCFGGQVDCDHILSIHLLCSLRHMYMYDYMYIRCQNASLASEPILKTLKETLVGEAVTQLNQNKRGFP